MAEASPATMLADQTAEEAKSVVGSLITQLMNMARTVIAYIMEMVRRFIQWAGEHPLATTMLACNIMVWVS